jgi:hypothetical protein
MVKEVTRPTSYRLCNLDGNDIKNSWHIDLLRRFYVLLPALVHSIIIEVLSLIANRFPSSLDFFYNHG